MKIQQTKFVLNALSVFSAIVFLMNMLVLGIQISRSSGYAPIVFLVVLLALVGLVIAIESWRAWSVRQGKCYLYVKGTIVYFHEWSLFGRERWSVVVNLQAYDHFLIRKSWLYGEVLVGKKRVDGKIRRLFVAGVFDRSASEVAGLFNDAKGPVVAAYREDPGEKGETFVS